MESSEPTKQQLEQAYLADAFKGIKEILKNGSGSVAALAVVEMMEAGVNVALFKHNRRGDSWIEELPLEACVALSKAKCARVSLIFSALASGNLTEAEALEEFIDESMDVAIYMAFSWWHVEHGDSPFSK